MKPPRSQFTLSELMALVALCAVGFALLVTPAALLGLGVLVVVPGFVLGRARGGTGIIGGTASGCLIPMTLASLWAAVEWLTGIRTIRETLDFFPALYLLFAGCLVWSSAMSGLLYLIDRKLQGPQRSSRLATTTWDPGIRFLPDDDGWPGRGSARNDRPPSPEHSPRGASNR